MPSAFTSITGKVHSFVHPSVNSLFFQHWAYLADSLDYLRSYLTYHTLHAPEFQ